MHLSNFLMYITICMVLWVSCFLSFHILLLPIASNGLHPISHSLLVPAPHHPNPFRPRTNGYQNNNDSETWCLWGTSLALRCAMQPLLLRLFPPPSLHISLFYLFHIFLLSLISLYSLSRIFLPHLSRSFSHIYILIYIYIHTYTLTASSSPSSSSLSPFLASASAQLLVVLAALN